MCRDAFFSHKNQCACISYWNEYEEANCTESKEKEDFFPFERQNLRLAGFGCYLYYVLFLIKRGGSKLSSLDFSLNSHRILRQPNDIPYVKLFTIMGRRKETGSHWVACLALNWLWRPGWPGTQNPPASTSEEAVTTGTTTDPALSQLLTQG